VGDGSLESLSYTSGSQSAATVMVFEDGPLTLSLQMELNGPITMIVINK